MKYTGTNDVVGQPDSSPSGGGMSGGGVVSSIVNLGTAIYSAEQQKRLQKQNIKANKEMAEYQYSKELEMWNRMNDYNSPSAQMQRFADAGLNPNLIYGQGNSGNASSMPHYQAPQQNLNYAPADITGVIGEYQNFEMRQAQIDNLKATNANINARTLSEASRNFLLDVQGKRGSTALEHEEYVLPDKNAIVGNQARASEAKVQQEWERVRLLSQQAIIQNLDAQQRKANLTTTQLEQQKRQADLIFQKYRNEWAKQGVTSGDHFIIRALVRKLNEAGWVE